MDFTEIYLKWLVLRNIKKIAQQINPLRFPSHVSPCITQLEYSQSVKEEVKKSATKSRITMIYHRFKIFQN